MINDALEYKSNTCSEVLTEEHAQKVINLMRQTVQTIVLIIHSKKSVCQVKIRRVCKIFVQGVIERLERGGMEDWKRERTV